MPLFHSNTFYSAQDGKSLGHIGNHLGQNTAASLERYSHLSGEETLETGASITKMLYGLCGQNADKFADRWNIQKAKYPLHIPNTGGAAGAQTPDHLIKSHVDTNKNNN